MEVTPKRKPIADRLGMFPEAWRPEPDDQLVGTVVEVSERDGGFGSYPIVTVCSNGDGREYAIHGYHTVLKNEFASLRPAAGDQIGVAYFGKPDGKDYEAYRVIVEKPNAEPKADPDWDKLAAESEAELHDEEAY